MKYNFFEAIDLNIGQNRIAFPSKGGMHTVIEADKFGYSSNQDDYNALLLILKRNNIKFNWVVISGKSAKVAKQFLAVVGDLDNPYMVWLSNSTESSLYFKENKRKFSVPYFLKFLPHIQDNLVRGHVDTFDSLENIRNEFPSGTIVKVCGSPYPYYGEVEGVEVTDHLLRIVPYKNPNEVTSRFVCVPPESVIKVTHHEADSWRNTHKTVTSVFGIDPSKPDISKLVKFNGSWDTFDVTNKFLDSLEGCPKTINVMFDASLNNLKDLRGSPQVVNGSFLATHCLLESLHGGPHTVTESFNVSSNPLSNLEGAPKHVGKCVYLTSCNIKSFKDIQIHFPSISDTLHVSYMADPHILYVFLIKNLRAIQCYKHDAEFNKVVNIVNKFLKLGIGKAALLKCQMELINQGYDKYAEL